MAQKFPHYMYDAKGNARYVATEDQAAAAKRDGFSAKYVPSHFPKCLYGPEGQTQTVNSEAELKSYIDAGYGENYVAPPAVMIVTEKSSSGGQDDATVRALMADNRELYARVEELEVAAANLVTKLGELQAKFDKIATELELA